MPAAKFRPPFPPALGDVVMWKHSHTADDDMGAVAVVVKVGHDAIGLWIIPPDMRTGLTKDGVHHALDPDNKTRQLDESGVWFQTPKQLALAALIADLGS